MADAAPSPTCSTASALPDAGAQRQAHAADRTICAQTPDPDRGWALAALTGDLDFAAAKPALLRSSVEERIDPVLFGYSYDYVGDLAETVGADLAEPPSADAEPPTRRSAEVVETLQRAPRRTDGPAVLARLLDRARRRRPLGPPQAGDRRPAHRRLGAARQAGARRPRRAVDVTEIEEVWHGLTPPYRAAVRLAGGQGRRSRHRRRRRSSARSCWPTRSSDADLDDARPRRLSRAEWKWDGIRVQAVVRGGVQRLYSPHRRRHLRRLSRPPRGDRLRRRARRRAAGRRPAARHRHLLRPAAAAEPQDRDAEDAARSYPALRPLLRPAAGSRARTCAPCPSTSAAPGSRPSWRRSTPARFDLSPLVPLHRLGRISPSCARRSAAIRSSKGVMLKRGDIALSRRPAQGPVVQVEARSAHWSTAVLMYAQRGHGKRSSFYSDYTFGVWRGPEGAEELAPVGKAYFGFTDEELRQLDKWVRDNTTDRFGPVRAVRAEPRPRPRAGGRLRGPEPLDPPQVGRRHALPAHLAPALGQAARRGRPHRDAAGAAGLSRVGGWLTARPTP